MKHLSPALALGWQPGNSIGIMHEPGAKLGLTIRDVIAALACLVIVLCSGGCEEQGALPPEGRNQTYRGVLEVKMGIQAFHPETGAGPWWFSGDSGIWDSLNQRDETGNADLQFYIAEIEFRGRLDEDGNAFGNMGAYPAEIHAVELLSMRYLDRLEAEEIVTGYKEDYSGG